MEKSGLTHARLDQYYGEVFNRRINTTWMVCSVFSTQTAPWKSNRNLPGSVLYSCFTQTNVLEGHAGGLNHGRRITS